MHRRLLPTEKWRWYREDVGRPFGVAALVAGILRLLPMPANNLALGANILIVSSITLGATAITTFVTRDWIETQISKWKSPYAPKS